jgi:hypothetical protein
MRSGSTSVTVFPLRQNVPMISHNLHIDPLRLRVNICLPHLPFGLERAYRS